VQAGDNENGRNEPRIGTVASTIAILRLLASASAPLGVNAIARSLSLSPSSCFNILKTLVSENIVDFDPNTKLYTLGAGLVSIARNALDPDAAYEIVRSRLEALAETWGMTAGLWRAHSERILLVGYVAGARMMRIQMTVGQRLPKLIGSVGRCMAASMDLDRAELARRFAELRWESPPTFDEYYEQVQEARRQGWSIDRGQFVRGATTIAVPLQREDGHLKYCLVSTMFTGQHDDDKVPLIVKELQQIARWASRPIDGSGIAQQQPLRQASRSVSGKA
jgi:DNA-binding IclR family transcriptional regulator